MNTTIRSGGYSVVVDGVTLFGGSTARTSRPIEAAAKLASTLKRARNAS